VIEMYQAGERSGAIAESVGINRKTVTTIVRRNGGVVLAQGAASGRRPWREFTDEEVSEMASMWGDGRSQTYIAHRFSTAQVVVSRVLRAAGITKLGPRSGNRTGADSASWKGGVVNAEGGYLGEWVSVDAPYASMRNRTGYVLQHRLVMARSLGRSLTRHETVHHINGVRDDNRPENLQLRQGRHGAGVRYVCADCGSHNIKPTKIGEE
jgi:hypothetical protein